MVKSAIDLKSVVGVACIKMRQHVGEDRVQHAFIEISITYAIFKKCFCSDLISGCNFGGNSRAF
jgi:hypothetical protein